MNNEDIKTSKEIVKGEALCAYDLLPIIQGLFS